MSKDPIIHRRNERNKKYWLDDGETHTFSLIRSDKLSIESGRWLLTATGGDLWISPYSETFGGFNLKVRNPENLVFSSGMRIFAYPDADSVELSLTRCDKLYNAPGIHTCSQLVNAVRAATEAQKPGPE